MQFTIKDHQMLLVLCALCSLSHVQLCMTPWTAACQAPLSVEFPRQEFWSELPFPSPEDLPDPRIEPVSPVQEVSPALHVDSLPLSNQGSPVNAHAFL